MYSPLRHYGLDQPGMKVGVVGLGGLGHAAVLIGKVPPPPLVLAPNPTARPRPFLDAPPLPLLHSARARVVLHVCCVRPGHARCLACGASGVSAPRAAEES